jgi:hypothetical protein
MFGFTLLSKRRHKINIYVRAAVPELGVWFRHFRPVDDIRYFGDFITNASSWEPITMTPTITPLRDPQSASYKLIEPWLNGAVQ